MAEFSGFITRHMLKETNICPTSYAFLKLIYFFLAKINVEKL
jgi:hypothetical protein